MTQLEKTEALLKDLQVPWRIDENDYGKTLIVEAKSSPCVIGYSGFAAELNFSGKGTFVNVGIWG